MRHSYAKFSDLVDFDDCIGKITSKSIRLQPIFNKKRLECPRQVAARFFLYGHPHEKMSHSHANDFWHKGELVLGIKGNQLRAFLEHFNSIAPETPQFYSAEIFEGFQKALNWAPRCGSK